MATNEQELVVLIESKPLSLVEPEHSGNATIVDQALAEIHFSEAAKKVLLDPKAATEDDEDSLNSIALTQEHLAQIKESLIAIVDSLQDNPSLISRAALFWGELPLWQRIVGGVVISGPTLLIGAAAHIGFLVTISGVSAFALTTTGIVLDDHHYHTKNITKKLKEGICGVAEVLGLTISALDAVRSKLAKQIDRFRQENEKLASSVIKLQNEVEALGAQVEVLAVTELLLRKTNEDMAAAVANYKHDQAEQAKKFEELQLEAETNKELHAKSLTQLSEKNAELAKAKQLVETEVEKARVVTTALEATVKKISGALFSDASQKEAFLDQLKVYISEKSDSFAKVADRMSETETELAAVKEELKLSNQQFRALLKRQEAQIKRLEDIESGKSIAELLKAQTRRLEGLNGGQMLSAQNDDLAKERGLLSLLSFLASPQDWLPTSGNSQALTKVAPSTLPKELNNGILLSVLGLLAAPKSWLTSGNPPTLQHAPSTAMSPDS